MWWKYRKRQVTTAAPETHEEIREEGRASLSDIAKRVKAVELITRKHSSAHLLGQYKSRFKGQGMQFSDFRVYQYGDDTRHIDWRTSARHQDTYVKTFEEERELNILCVVDVSASNLFGTEEYNKQEVLCIALAAIAFSAIENNDRVGLILFADGVERYVPPKKGKKHVLRIIDELLACEPKKKGTNLTKALEFVSGIAKHNSVILLASDFFAPIDKKRLTVLAQKHDLITLHATDPRDTTFPALGLMELEDPETGETLLVDTTSTWFRKQFSESQRKQLQTSLDILRQSGASLVKLGTDRDPSRDIAKFFRERKRARR